MSQNKKSRKSKKKKPLPHGWEVHPSKTYPDRVYFYNTITKCSSWENPCEPVQVKASIKKTTDESSVISSCSSIKSSKSTNRKRKRLDDEILKSRNELKSFLTNVTDIDDYDEDQDKFFEDVSIHSYNSTFSKGNSPPGSPDFSSNLTDSDSSKSNLLLEHSSSKQLWKYFTSPKKNGKNSIALSDLTPTTSKNTVTKEVDLSINKNKDYNTLFDNTHFNSESGNLKGREWYEKSLKTGIRERECHTDLSNNLTEKSSTKKTIKNISFKVTDKTPAQSRLLKLRKQISESQKSDVIDKTPAQTNLLKFRKKLSNLIKLPDFAFPKNINNKKELENINNNSKIVTRDRFGEYKFVTNTSTKETEFSSSDISQRIDFNADDFSEEMDWESNEELVVKNINDFRLRQPLRPEEPSELHFHLTPEHTRMLPSARSCCILVLDTNILISCLSFIRELRDTKIPGEGYPILYIPWRVLQELDHLKFSKTNGIEKDLCFNVRKAISYLNDCFKAKHPRCKGQSFQDFEKMVHTKPCAPDDEILQTCIQLKKLYYEKKLIFLTNDKNLESKAIVNDIEVYSKDTFYKKYLSRHNNTGSLKDALGELTSVAMIKLDDFICHLKNVLKNIIPLVVETELKLAFRGDWLKIVFRKPPWTLQDALDCFIKHWMSVFSLVLPKESKLVVEELYEKLFKSEPDTMEDLSEIIKLSQKFINFIKNSDKSNRIYMESVNITAQHLCKMLQESTRKLSCQEDSPVLVQSYTQNQPQGYSQFTPESQSESYISEFGQVKDLFRGIWDSLRSYCCSVSDIINGSSVNITLPIPEIRLKLSIMINDVTELIVNIEKIFEININYINEAHPVILHLSNFLVRTLPLLSAEMQSKLPKCLALFCSNLEGRTLLSKSLSDFKDFEMDLKKASEYFDVSFGSVLAGV